MRATGVSRTDLIVGTVRYGSAGRRIGGDPSNPPRVHVVEVDGTVRQPTPAGRRLVERIHPRGIRR